MYSINSLDAHPIQLLTLAGASYISKLILSFDEKRIYAVDQTRGVIRVIVRSECGMREGAQVYVPRRHAVSNIVVALSADDRKLYVGVTEPGGTIHVLDADDPQKDIGTIEAVTVPADLFTAGAEPRLFAIAQGGLNNDLLYVINTETDKVEKALPGFSVATRVVATHDGRRVFISTGDRLFLVTFSYFNNVQKTVQLRVDGGVITLALAPNETTLLVAVQPNRAVNTAQILSYNAKNGNQCTGTKPVAFDALPESIAIATDIGQLFAPFNNGSQILTGNSQALECTGGDSFE